MDTINVVDLLTSSGKDSKPFLDRKTYLENEEPVLIEQLKNGDHEAFEAIFSLYGNKVYNQALRLLGNSSDAEDVVQEVFLLVYRKSKSFQGKSKFSTWLYRLTMNAAITKLRKSKDECVSIDDFLPKFSDDGHHSVRPVVDWSQEVDKLASSLELSRVISQALDRLQPIDKAVLVLSDLEELSNREISEILGLSILAVKARLHRARLFLRGKLAAHLGY
ncbi:MAG: sigma-70 family RNA polymerase sigma factor [Thermodesulfobacteriota bacterium]